MSARGRAICGTPRQAPVRGSWPRLDRVRHDLLDTGLDDRLDSRSGTGLDAALGPRADPGASSADDAALPEVHADPGVVWHYTDGAGLISILRHDVLWATASPFLNDAEEVGLGLGLLMRAAQRLGADGDPFWRDVTERVRQSGARHGPSAGVFFILSASRAWDSLAMWRCYGKAREAYAIGLDASVPLQVLGDPDGHPQVDAPDDGLVLRHRPWAPVHYAEADQQRLVTTTLDALQAAARDLGADPRHQPALQALERMASAGPTVAESVLDDLEECLLLIKHPGFAEEQETRHSTVLYTGEQARTETFLRYRATDYGIAPYLHLTGPDPRHPGAVGTNHSHRLPVRAVAIGPSPNGAAATESVQSLLRGTGHGDVPVLRSQIPFRT